MLFVCLISFICFQGVFSATCCTPTQWEGSISLIGEAMVNRNTRVFEGNVRMHYDAVNQKKAAFSTMTVNGVDRKAFLIEDYNTGLRYMVRGNRCNVSKTKDTFQENCVPDFAKLVSTTHMGLGDTALGVTNYEVDLQYRGSFTKEKLSVTNDQCVPVTKRVVSTGMRGDVITTNLFTGITAGITDADVFIPPEICNDSILYYELSRSARSADHDVNTESFEHNFNIYDARLPDIF